jgi:hypothetical protein
MQCEQGSIQSRSRAGSSGEHLLAGRNPRTGPIALGGYQVYIGDKEVTLDTVNEFASGKDHVLKVTSLDGAEFKGVSVLLSKESVDLTAGLLVSEDSPTYQRNSRCSSDNSLVGGVTHRDSTFKKEPEATLRVDRGVKDLLLDVNVVLQNNATGSIYFHTTFKLNALGRTARIPKFRTCGLLGLSVFCPHSRCGWIGRIFWLCKG